jgi:hypothetical protein
MLLLCQLIMNIESDSLPSYLRRRHEGDASTSAAAANLGAGNGSVSRHLLAAKFLQQRELLQKRCLEAQQLGQQVGHIATLPSRCSTYT